MNIEYQPASPPIPRTLDLERRLRVAPPEPSPDVVAVAAMFGLGADAEREITVIPPCRLTLRGGELVFVTGPSGSGKSTLLGLIHDALAPPGRDGADADATIRDRDDPPPRVLAFDALPELPDRPLVDALPAATLEDRLRLLSLAGLGDAPVMLRRPAELSDGQRYRLRLAHTMALAELDRGDGLVVVLADEFGATLDRLTAANVARQLRKWVRRQPGVCVACATTHDDLLEPLDPDTLVEVPLGQRVIVHDARRL